VGNYSFIYQRELTQNWRDAVILKPSYFKSAIDIPIRMSDIEHLNILLDHMVKEGSSDLFLCGDDFAWIKKDSSMVRITKRIIKGKEVIDMLTAFYGLNAATKLGMPEPIDIDLEYREKIGINEVIRHRFRVNAVNAKSNGRLVADLTIRSIASQPPKASDLEIEDCILDICKNSQQGLFLMVGSTGNGKTTTLAGIIRDMLEMPNANRKMVTIEEPIEYVYDDIDKPSSIIRQFQVGQSTKSFATGLKSALRQAPDDILIGEARDLETISLATEACVTGHFVLSTVHSNSVAETIPRMVNPFDVSVQRKVTQELIQAMQMIVAQRLVPTVDGKRMALREWLQFTPEVKALLSESNNVTLDIKRLVFSQGHSMFKSATEAFKKGLIDKETLEKVRFNYGDKAE
jgi:defect-in-organelle-trafficking protein DotB